MIWNQAGLYKQDTLIFPGNLWMSSHHHYQPFTFGNQRKTQDWIIWMQIDSPLKGTMALSEHQWRREMGKRSGNEDQVSWLKPTKDLCPSSGRFSSRTRNGRDFESLFWHLEGDSYFYEYLFFLEGLMFGIPFIFTGLIHSGWFTSGKIMICTLILSSECFWGSTISCSSR